METLLLVASRKKLIIFDLDGTLIDLGINWKECRKIFRKYALNIFNINFDEDLRVDQMEGILLEKFGEDEFDNIFSLRKKFEASGMEKSSLNKKLIELIKQWKEEKKILAICSNNSQSTVENFLHYYNLKDIFEFVIGVSKNFPPKPNTKSCKEILNHFDISERDSLFIGDRIETDGETAKILKIDYFNKNSDDNFDFFNYSK